MEAWDVLVVGGGTAALRAAIAAHDAGASVALIEGGAVGSSSTPQDSGGLAVSLGELNSTAHAADTIQAGAGLCDPAIVATRCAAAFDNLAELERWGLVLRRDEQGLPLLLSAPGHSEPRLATTGDTTGREIYNILDEQCSKRNIPRRGDMQPHRLVLDGEDTVGLIALDVLRGELIAIQAKSVILATSGFQSAWNGDGVGDGTGVWLAHKAGIELANMEFLAWTPLAMQSHGLSLPLAILNDGATVRSAAGADVEFAADSGLHSSALLVAAEQCVLDARVLERGVDTWYADTAERVESRTGNPMDEVVVPIAAKVETTLGGIPCDGDGKVSGINGLFAAGDCACSGFNGADQIAGNRTLDALDGGRCAGTAAADSAATQSFSGATTIDDSLAISAGEIASFLNSTEGGRRGALANQLATTMSSAMGLERDSATLTSASSTVASLIESRIALSDKSDVMNTELVEVIRMQGILQLSAIALTAAGERSESCGSHHLSTASE